MECFYHQLQQCHNRLLCIKSIRFSIKKSKINNHSCFSFFCICISSFPFLFLFILFSNFINVFFSMHQCLSPLKFNCLSLALCDTVCNLRLVSNFPVSPPKMTNITEIENNKVKVT